jgi:hypothetical protein
LFIVVTIETVSVSTESQNGTAPRLAEAAALQNERVWATAVELYQFHTGFKVIEQDIKLELAIFTHAG